MKSFRDVIVFGSTLAAVAAVLAGCDDDAEAGASCAQICPNVMAAKCENDPDCMATCNKVKDSTPMGCTDVYNALTRCYAGAKFTCDGDEQSVAKECSQQERAYAECLTGGGKDGGAKDTSDAGDDGSHGGSTKGTGGTKGSGSGMKGSGVTMLMHLSGGTQTHDAGAGAGSDGGSGGSSNQGGGGSGGTTSGNDCSGETVEGACDQCILAACCDEAVACANDADCVALEDCVAQCSDADCVQACADASSSSAIDVYNTLITCATDHCQSVCSEGTDAGPGAGGSDVGAPNDGNTGHGSATTPPNCLYVPPDVTGYCGDSKYKVIYDCPAGPPYDDCAFNTMNSSGIYCCGH
jgi:hypothetical protein